MCEIQPECTTQLWQMVDIARGIAGRSVSACVGLMGHVVGQKHILL